MNKVHSCFYLYVVTLNMCELSESAPILLCVALTAPVSNPGLDPSSAPSKFRSSLKVDCLPKNEGFKITLFIFAGFKQGRGASVLLIQRPPLAWCG